jgi:ketosteroid isomerase-like protein
MKRFFLPLLLFCLLSRGGLAQQPEGGPDLKTLVNTERAFSKTSEAKGMRDAFLAYLADDGILFRPNPVSGKKWWLERPPAEGLLTWEPIFADVSRAGDLGYTTGPWEFREKGPDDTEVAHGNFVTVWKKQADGTWKFVIDLGISNPPPVARVVYLETPSKNQKAFGKPKNKFNIESERAALIDRDREFSKASVNEGAVIAFLHYAADSVRLFRSGKSPLVGKGAAAPVFGEKQGTIAWNPVKSDVARSGDLGYTYGAGEIKEAGETQRFNYVRIWKRLSDGGWKVVLDVINSIPPANKPASQD